ncbi:MAG: hypothetical protein IKP66_01150 [Lachnospiraceae bacterium]|jgi:hypothetical protein|nr:hypothetical protein [Lachnospiraceae bacterium]
MKENYERFLAKLVLCFVITTLIGYTLIQGYVSIARNKGFFVNTYKVDDYTAIETYNENSVKFLLDNFRNTTTIYSPLCVESAYAYYAQNNHSTIDNIFYVFGNGFQNFNLSMLLLKDASIKCFTVGAETFQSVAGDIAATPNDKLVLDEINAKFNTLSDGKLIFKATQHNVFDYNIYSMCIIDETIAQKCNEYEDTYIIQGSFQSYIADDVQYIVVPFENSDYELVLKKGVDLYYNPKLKLYTENRDMSIILPKLTLESVENPSKYYVKTQLNKDFEGNKDLTNVTSICHLNVHCDITDDVIDTEHNVLDFSHSCIYAIRNKTTGQLVIVGNIL